MKAIQYLINSVLPEDIRDYTRTYDTKSINELQSLIAEKYPDRYRDIMDKLMDIARKSVYYSGQTLKLSDFKPPFDKEAALEEMHKEVQFLRRNIKDENKKLTRDDIYKFNLGVDWSTVEMQCNQVTAFINEVTNIKLGQSNEAQPRYTIKRINSKITKDKFSSISYMLYFAKLYLDEEEEPTSEDVNDYVTVGFGNYNMNLYY